MDSSLRIGALGLLVAAVWSCHARDRGEATPPDAPTIAEAPSEGIAEAPSEAPAEPPPPATPRPTTPRVQNTAAAPRTTACRHVAHIGDSTSTGTMNDKVIRDPELRLDRRYASVGVEAVVVENFGGRSLIEHRPENENGLMVANRLRAAGFRGCWVIGLGTNDAANVAKDPSIGPPERIARMMEIIGDEPVLWVDATTRRRDGYWAAHNMQVWNRDLEATLARYPNASVYAWSAEMQDEWYNKDGIHYNVAGYTARAERIPRALAAAFPGE